MLNSNAILRLARNITQERLRISCTKVFCGTVQGLGYALMEELIHKDGVVLNPNLADYYVPTSLDIPEIKTIVLEYPGALGPYGAKAMGEPPIVLPAPAVVNAN